MQVNHPREIIRAPYVTDLIKNAPAFNPGVELTEAGQRQVFEYYQRFHLLGTELSTAYQPPG